MSINSVRFIIRQPSNLIDGNNSVTSTQNVDYNRGVLSKTYNDENISKHYITWTIGYEPYKFKTPDKAVYLEDELGEGLKIRRNEDKTLAFDGGNYQMLEGRLENGQFVQEKVITRETLKTLLSYDDNKRVLTIKIPNRDKVYRFIYVTDVVGKTAGEKVNNKVKLMEGSSTTHIEAPKEYKIAKAYMSGYSESFPVFTIYKTDETGAAGLKQAKFTIKGENTDLTVETNKEGKVTTDNLPFTTYTVKETVAPEGYDIKDNAVEFKVKINKLDGGKVQISLVDNYNPLVTIKDDVITVKNTKKRAGFKIIKASSDDKDKTNLADIKRLKGAQFALTRVGSTTPEPVVNNGNGEFEFKNLIAGVYDLEEKVAPANHKGLESKTYRILVDPTQNDGEKISVLKLTDGQYLPLTPNDTDIKKFGDTFVVFNERTQPDAAEFKLIKTDLVYKGATRLADIKAYLNGAKFSLIGDFGNGGTYAIPAVTGENGENGTIIFKNLKAGTYTLRETEAPKGYFILAKEYKITITPGAIKPEIAIKDANPNQIKLIENTVVVFNKPVTKTLDIPLVKADLVDANANDLNGVTHKLDGAEFTLTNDVTEEVITSVAAQGKGNLIFKAVKPGTYTLKETRRPAGYEGLTKTYKVTVTKDTGNGPNFKIEVGNDKNIKVLGGKIVVFNEKVYDLELVKADVAEGNINDVNGFTRKLEGAKFSLIATPGGAIAVNRTTGADGKLTFTGLKKGTYILKEEKAPNGYALVKATYEITINPNAAEGNRVTIKKADSNQIKKIGDTVVFFDEKLYDLEIKKADLVDKSATELNSLTTLLNGAKFTLVKKDDATSAPVEKVTGDGADKGTLVFKGIKQGTYILKETEAPNGYASLIKEYEITINTSAMNPVVTIKAADPNQIKQIDNTIVVFNEKLIDLDLYKADLADKDKNLNEMLVLGGAKFKLTSVSDPSVSYEATTATEGAMKGRLTFKNLKKDIYTLEETEAPEGYAKLFDSYEITVTPSAVKSEVAIKDVKSDQIRQIGETIIVFNEKVLDLKLIKASLTDKDATSAGAVKTRLLRAGFKLVYDNTVSYSAITDGQGEITFKGLKTGTYTLEETGAPDGYNSLISPYTIEVTASATESKVEIKDANNNQIKKLEDGEIVVFNEKKEDSFDLRLIKADLADRSADAEADIRHPLNGAEFRLELKSDPETVSKTAITAAGGILTFNGLNGGVYTLKEIKAPEGYVSLMNEYEITVTPGAVSGTRVAIKDADGNQIKRIGDTIVVFNEKTYNLKLLKADLDVNKDIVAKTGITLGAIKTPLNGARFRLVLKNNSAVSYSALTGDSAASAGSLTFKGLKSGVYTLTEETAPGGYTGISQSYEITVTATAINTEFAIKDAKEGEIRKVDDAVVVFNKKNPTPPPIIPENPGTPDNPPTPPTPPNPTPNIPSYPADNPPDPNDPNSPDEFVAVDDEGTPQGKYVKSKKPDGTNEYIPVDEDGTPLGVNKAKKKLPKTGGSDSMVYYAGGIMFILLAAGMVVVKRKKYNE